MPGSACGGNPGLAHVCYITSTSPGTSPTFSRFHLLLRKADASDSRGCCGPERLRLPSAQHVVRDRTWSLHPSHLLRGLLRVASSALSHLPVSLHPLFKAWSHPSSPPAGLKSSGSPSPGNVFLRQRGTPDASRPFYYLTSHGSRPSACGDSKCIFGSLCSTCRSTFHRIAIQ